MTLRTVTTLVATGAVGAALGLGSPAVADTDGMLFTGAGRGPTAEVAIRSALGDAATSASAYQLYNCVQIGEAQVFESTNDPNFGHVFRAQVDAFCTR